MDQPYSIVADWLSKFHTWPESIQALWLIAVPVTVLGVTWIVMRGLREVVAAWLGRGEAMLHRAPHAWDGPLLSFAGGRLRVAKQEAPLLPPSPSSLGLSRGSTS
jgi:hypothetical protein